MKLYQWKSGTFADYSKGDIITYGQSVADARKRVLAAAKLKYANCANQEYAKQQIEGIKFDLKNDPEVLEEGAAFITGSA